MGLSCSAQAATQAAPAAVALARAGAPREALPGRIDKNTQASQVSFIAK